MTIMQGYTFAVEVPQARWAELVEVIGDYAVPADKMPSVRALPPTSQPVTLAVEGWLESLALGFMHDVGFEFVNVALRIHGGTGVRQQYGSERGRVESVLRLSEPGSAVMVTDEEDEDGLEHVGLVLVWDGSQVQEHVPQVAWPTLAGFSVGSDAGQRRFRLSMLQLGVSL